jgi:hypothetical protein
MVTAVRTMATYSKKKLAASVQIQLGFGRLAQQWLVVVVVVVPADTCTNLESSCSIIAVQ